ncbi:MAG: DUF5011 domain-containing protein [Owenweeksia sp.]
MKTLNRIFLFLAVSLMFVSCSKEESSANVSRLTNYPTFKKADGTVVSGALYESIVVGTTYSDPGLIATEGGEEIPVTTSGTVDGSTVGIYTITYSATNKDGFDGSVTKYVAVLPAADAANIAGKYSNVGSFVYTANIVEVAPGFYRTDNCWGGSSAAVIAALFICVDGADIIMPLHSISVYGPISGTGTLSATGLITWELTLENFSFTATKMWQKI